MPSRSIKPYMNNWGKSNASFSISSSAYYLSPNMNTNFQFLQTHSLCLCLLLYNNFNLKVTEYICNLPVSGSSFCYFSSSSSSVSQAKTSWDLPASQHSQPAQPAALSLKRQKYIYVLFKRYRLPTYRLCQLSIPVYAAYWKMWFFSWI